MIIDYIVSHQAEFWMVIGFALLAAEILTGFTVGVFLFAGIGALVTGGLMSFGFIAETWILSVIHLLLKMKLQRQSLEILNILV